VIGTVATGNQYGRGSLMARKPRRGDEDEQKGGIECRRVEDLPGGWPIGRYMIVHLPLCIASSCRNDIAPPLTAKLAPRRECRWRDSPGLQAVRFSQHRIPTAKSEPLSRPLRLSVEQPIILNALTPVTSHSQPIAQRQARRCIPKKRCQMHQAAHRIGALKIQKGCTP
jgi:hypothetical protein